jgi:hypothetical protein
MPVLVCTMGLLTLLWANKNTHLHRTIASLDVDGPRQVADANVILRGQQVTLYRISHTRRRSDAHRVLVPGSPESSHNWVGGGRSAQNRSASIFQFVLSYWVEKCERDAVVKKTWSQTSTAYSGQSRVRQVTFPTVHVATKQGWHTSR